MNALLAPQNAASLDDRRSERRGTDAAGDDAVAAGPRGGRARSGGARDDGGDVDRNATPTRRARVRRAVAATGVVVALAAIATAGSWGPRALSRLAFFRVRRVEIEGTRYASPRALVARLAVDTTASVWMDVAVLTRRVASDPLVADARVERRLPGVLRVVVHERVPVAIVPGARGALVVYDATGVALPLSPARVGGVDVPLAASADPALLRALGALRAGAPRVYARVLEAARAPRAAAGAVGPAPLGGASSAPDRDELDFVLAAEPPAAAAPGSAAASSGSVFVRAAVDVNAARFSDLAPVERDLARRGVRAAELDLRFRDQVVARLP